MTKKELTKMIRQIVENYDDLDANNYYNYNDAYKDVKKVLPMLTKFSSGMGYSKKESLAIIQSAINDLNKIYNNIKTSLTYTD